MGLLKSVKELEKKFDLGRGKYKFNKWVFNIMVLLMLVIVLFVWADYDFGNIKQPHIYLECESPNPICENNFYDICNPESYEFIGEADICSKVDSKLYEKEFLYEGESVGIKPSWLAVNAESLFILLILLAFLVNHLVMNKGYKFKRFEVK